MRLSPTVLLCGCETPLGDWVADRTGLPTDCWGSDAVVFSTDSGTTDLTTDFCSGTAESPADVVLDKDGTLQIGPGTWYVSLEITGNVVVEGAATAETVLAGEGRTIDSTGSILTVRDLTITGEDGVRFRGNMLTVEDCVLSGTKDKPALWATAITSVEIHHSTFSNNTSQTGAVYIAPEGADLRVEITQSIFSDNRNLESATTSAR